MYIILPVLIIIFVSAKVFSQNDTFKTFTKFTTNEAADLSNDLNYITYSYPRIQSDNFSPLIFETQIAPNFHVRFGSKFGFSMSPKVILRMFDTTSLPVKTPCYMPNITFFAITPLPFIYNSPLLNWWIKKEDITYFTLKIYHYSNGQDGSFYIPNTNQVNLKDGSFSTFYYEVAFNWARKDNKLYKGIKSIEDVVYGKISFEQQFYQEAPLSEIYYRYKISGQSSRTILETIRMILKPSIMFGNGNDTKYSVDFSTSWRFYKKSDFSLFARFYYGPDYYNLRYQNVIWNYSIGFLADPIALPLF